MKKYCLIKNNEVTQVGSLPINFENVSNFYLLSDEEIKPYGWLPVETISENKNIVVGTEYQIEENLVKEIITTRNLRKSRYERSCNTCSSSSLISCSHSSRSNISRGIRQG